ncbi:MAG: hypothetical protein VX589_05810, partial [Myxococcota bacterium]|nr:hypothetical protein [Myxococcota bacterium]
MIDGRWIVGLLIVASVGCVPNSDGSESPTAAEVDSNRPPVAGQRQTQGMETAGQPAYAGLPKMNGAAGLASITDEFAGGTPAVRGGQRTVDGQADGGTAASSGSQSPSDRQSSQDEQSTGGGPALGGNQSPRVVQTPMGAPGGSGGDTVEGCERGFQMDANGVCMANANDCIRLTKTALTIHPPAGLRIL